MGGKRSCRGGGHPLEPAGFARAVIVGILVGGLLEFFGIVFAGGGHGTFLPFAVFFGPLIGPFALLERAAECLGVDLSIAGSKLSRLGVFVASFGGGVLLYGAYAAVLRHIRQRRERTRVAPWTLVFLHHGLGTAALMTLESDDWRAAEKLLSGGLFWWTVAAVGVYGGAHLLAGYQLRSACCSRSRGFPVRWKEDSPDRKP